MLNSDSACFKQPIYSGVFGCPVSIRTLLHTDKRKKNPNSEIVLCAHVTVNVTLHSNVVVKDASIFHTPSLTFHCTSDTAIYKGGKINNK